MFLRYDLIEAIINCLHQLTDWKVQEKWGNELLRNYLVSSGDPQEPGKVSKDEQKLEKRRLVLVESLETKMKAIEESHSSLSGIHSSG